MQLRCPACHALMSLEVATENDAARGMFAQMVALDGSLFRAVAAYLAFFRPDKGVLGWNRALSLTKDVLGLDHDRMRLEAALTTTIENLRAKREQPDWRPLTSHTYLRKVLQTSAKLEQWNADVAQTQLDIPSPRATGIIVGEPEQTPAERERISTNIRSLRATLFQDEVVIGRETES